MNGNLVQLVETSIEKRAERRQLHVSLAHMRYVQECFFEDIPAPCRGKALYVGCGHGHDALLALLDGFVTSVVGIDPYEEGGNDNEDYVELLSLIDACGLTDRFTVLRGDAVSYVRDVQGEFDLIVCADVMHHIFETPDILHRSDLYDGAVQVFGDFATACTPHGMMAISEVHRHALRPFLKNLGVLKGHVDYTTKQNWGAWSRTATAGGWSLSAVRNYIPYAFRGQRWWWSGILGRYTLCDRYFLYHSKQDPGDARRPGL